MPVKIASKKLFPSNPIHPKTEAIATNFHTWRANTLHQVTLRHVAFFDSIKESLLEDSTTTPDLVKKGLEKTGINNTVNISPFDALVAWLQAPVDVIPDTDWVEGLKLLLNPSQFEHFKEVFGGTAAWASLDRNPESNDDTSTTCTTTIFSDFVKKTPNEYTDMALAVEPDNDGYPKHDHTQSKKVHFDLKEGNQQSSTVASPSLNNPNPLCSSVKPLTSLHETNSVTPPPPTPPLPASRESLSSESSSCYFHKPRKVHFRDNLPIESTISASTTIPGSPYPLSSPYLNDNEEESKRNPLEKQLILSNSTTSLTSISEEIATPSSLDIKEENDGTNNSNNNDSVCELAAHGVAPDIYVSLMNRSDDFKELLTKNPVLQSKFDTIQKNMAPDDAESFQELLFATREQLNDLDWVKNIGAILGGLSSPHYREFLEAVGFHELHLLHADTIEDEPVENALLTPFDDYSNEPILNQTIEEMDDPLNSVPLAEPVVDRLFDTMVDPSLATPIMIPDVKVRSRSDPSSILGLENEAPFFFNLLASHLDKTPYSYEIFWKIFTLPRSVMSDVVWLRLITKRILSKSIRLRRMFREVVGATRRNGQEVVESDHEGEESWVVPCPIGSEVDILASEGTLAELLENSNDADKVLLALNASRRKLGDEAWVNSILDVLEKESKDGWNVIRFMITLKIHVSSNLDGVIVPDMMVQTSINRQDSSQGIVSPHKPKKLASSSSSLSSSLASSSPSSSSSISGSIQSLSSEDKVNDTSSSSSPPSPSTREYIAGQVKRFVEIWGPLWEAVGGGKTFGQVCYEVVGRWEIIAGKPIKTSIGSGEDSKYSKAKSEKEVVREAILHVCGQSEVLKKWDSWFAFRNQDQTQYPSYNSPNDSLKRNSVHI